MYDTLSLGTCFDTLQDTDIDNQERTWIRKVLDAKIDLARFAAQRRGKGRAIEVVGYLKGAFIWASESEEKVVNEVRAIEFIRQNTMIPFPFVHAWGLTHERTDLEPASLLDKFYRQVAGYMLQLSRLKFKRIGAISKQPGVFAEEKDAWSSSSRPLTYNMNGLVTPAGYLTDSFPTTSFARGSDFFKNVAHEHLVNLRTQRNIAFAPDIARARYIARHRYLQLRGSYCSAEDDTGPFVPFRDDFRPANMFVDPDTMQITAMFDWEFTNAMPAQFSYDQPWWLLLTDPGSWVDRNAVQEFRELYEPRMEQFLRILEAVEAEEARDVRGDGDVGDRRPLSARRRSSWVEGRLWFKLASGKSSDVDTIYWKVLHDGGDAIELLDPEVRAGIDAAVEEKMAQLRDYRKEYAVHFPDKQNNDNQ
ncbi:hypothetical protein LZ31DRAFT_589424 [Colletotrichum somersetense]|nr:hypothetical protein LZ31DRAFT_589424 [Colletotrichum somersetense]